MYNHFSVQKNISSLQANGINIIEPESGFLACQTEGKGRMAEPEMIFNIITKFFSLTSKYSKINALVTAGPTYEPIDAVRFIGNSSSGLMGFSIA
jgi:phosphopantothenoylcysteine decarboxylase/phosphopantothenate--cysteine ligase